LLLLLGTQKKKSTNKFIIYMFIFFACPKKTNQQRSGERKGSRSLDSTISNCPVFLAATGSLKTRFAQTVKTAYSVVPAVLGCVKWLLKPVPIL